MILGFVLVMALIGAGSFGWGRALLALCRRCGWTEAFVEVSLPLAAVLGMGLFLAVFGVLLAFHLILVGLMVGWHVVGVVWLLIIRKTPRGARCLRDWWSWLRYAGAGAVVLLLSICALAYPIANTTYNPNDDDAAYLYLAKRMLATGAAIDPFNQRRLVSLGGSTLYQALILRFAGDSSLQTFEFVFCLLMLWMLVIRTIDRRWLIPGTLAVGLGLVIVHGVGPVSNTSPSFSGALFSLAIFQLLLLIRAGSIVRERALLCCIGLLFGAALTLRIYFGVALAIAIVLTLVWRRREITRWTSILFLPATTVLVLVGWSISSYESTRAWLFPLFSGNYISTFPGSSDPTVSLVGLLHRFGDVLTSVGFGGLLLASFVIGLIYLVRDRPHGGFGDVAIIAAVAALAQLAVFAKLQSGASLADMARFEAPSCLAVAMVTIDGLWSISPGGGPSQRSDSALALVRPTPAAAVRTTFAVLVLLATFGAQVPATYWDELHSALSGGTKALTGSVGLQEHYSQVELSEYRAISRLIPKGGQVFSAVDYPYLLEMNRYNVATLDIVGSVSPAPGMPLTTPGALVHYLRALGYRYIVFSNPQEHGLYDITSWKLDFSSQVYEYRQWAPYFVRWDRLIERVAHDRDFLTRQIGDLSLISLLQARAGTSSPHRSVGASGAPTADHGVIIHGVGFLPA